MTRQFCDRCDKDITGEMSGGLSLVRDADENGSGTVNNTWDLCEACVNALDVFIERPAAPTATKKKARS